MYDGQTCGNREIQCTNASGVDVLGHHRLAQVLNKRTTRRRGGAVFFTFDHFTLKWVNCEHSNGETRPVILRWTLWVCNWKKTEIRETIKTTQKQYKSKKWEAMGVVVEAWSSTLLSNSLLVDPQVPFCLSVQNIDKMTRSKHWRGLLLNIAQKLSKYCQKYLPRSLWICSLKCHKVQLLSWRKGMTYF